MTIKIEEKYCQHCMNCRVALADDTLPVSAYRGKETDRDEDDLLAVAAQCPVGAITVFE